jgi:hypothetical protein
MFSAASLILFLMRREMVLHELDNKELFGIINERSATLKQLHYSNKFAYVHFLLILACNNYFGLSRLLPLSQENPVAAKYTETAWLQIIMDSQYKYMAGHLLTRVDQKAVISWLYTPKRYFWWPLGLKGHEA